MTFPQFFVKSNAHEYLIVGRGGAIRNLGPAASAFLPPGATHVLVPSTQQEAIFEMRQESKDGIPLRFKGSAIYWIDEPVTAAKHYDFTQGAAAGVAEINAHARGVCLFALREQVSHMTMVECIEQRKTTLTEAVAAALRQVAHGQAGQPGWGIHIDVVQVAQVFIVDDELRRQLEAEVRNQLKSTSELSNINTQEAIQKAQSESKRRLQAEHLAAERERIQTEQEKHRLQQASEQEVIQQETPVRLLRLAKQCEVLAQERVMRRLENEIKVLTVENELMAKRAQQTLRQEILPLEQRPAIAEALANTFQGANLSFYGEGAPLAAALAPLVDLLKTNLQRVGHASD